MSTHSEKINELAAALSKAQGEMQAAIKESLNPFYKSKYADLGNVWDAARPVLSKNGLCVMQTTEIACGSGEIIMVTTLAHISGQWMKSYLPLNPSKKDSQGIGAAITYLRRYSLSALVGVVCDEDDDGETAVGRGKITKKEEIEPIRFLSASQTYEMQRLLTECEEVFKENFWKIAKENYKAHTIHEFPEEKYVGAIEHIKRHIENKKGLVSANTEDGSKK